MRKTILILSVLQFYGGFSFAGQPARTDSLVLSGDEKVVTFRFVPGDDMFYIPWGGNDVQLAGLYMLVDEYRTEIATGQMPVYVDGYCASLPTPKENLNTAFVSANRVKSELIALKGLTEDNFITKNYATAYTASDGTRYRDMVVVTLRIPTKEVREAEVDVEELQQEQPVVAEQLPEPEPEPVPEQKTEPQFPGEPPLVSRYSRWSVGANVGMPFFRGDMNSLSADKTYIGISVGVQAIYQISPLSGVSLSLDWARNKAGSRNYAQGYLLDAGGMTWYTPQSFDTRPYGELYSKINMFCAGLHFDLNVLRLFGPRVANGRFKLIVSPALYAQHFSSEVYTKADDKVFVGGNLSKNLSLGLGGDVALRYAVNSEIDLQIKGTGIWITDNGFDNIHTVGYAKQNGMWGASAGVVWKIGGNDAVNLLYNEQ